MDGRTIRVNILEPEDPAARDEKLRQAGRRLGAKADWRDLLAFVKAMWRVDRRKKGRGASRWWRRSGDE